MALNIPNPYADWQTSQGLAYDPNQWRPTDEGWMQLQSLGDELGGGQGWVYAAPYAGDENALRSGLINPADIAAASRNQFLSKVPYAQDSRIFDYTTNLIRRLDPNATEEDVFAAAQKASQLNEAPGQYMPTLGIAQRVAETYLTDKLGRPFSMAKEVPGFSDALSAAERQASEKSLSWQDALNVIGPLVAFGVGAPALAGAVGLGAGAAGAAGAGAGGTGLGSFLSGGINTLSGLTGLAPATIQGAGVGALTGGARAAATGQNVAKGALLGGVLGGGTTALANYLSPLVESQLGVSPVAAKNITSTGINFAGQVARGADPTAAGISSLAKLGMSAAGAPTVGAATAPAPVSDWTAGYYNPPQDVTATTGAPMDFSTYDLYGFGPDVTNDITYPGLDAELQAGAPTDFSTVFDTGPALTGADENIDPNAIGQLPQPNMAYGPNPLQQTLSYLNPVGAAKGIYDAFGGQGDLLSSLLRGGASAAGIYGLLNLLGSAAKPSGGGPKLPQYAGIDMGKYAPATTAAPTVYRPTYQDYRAQPPAPENTITAADGGLMALGHGAGNVTIGTDPRRNPSPLSQDNQNNLNWQERSEPLTYMAEGGGISSLGGYSDGGRLLKGPGDGMSDHIPATIGDKQPARLADGEFVIPADVVSHLGNGSTDAGAKVLYGMMNRIRKARTGNPKQGKQINPGKFTPA